MSTAKSAQSQSSRYESAVNKATGGKDAGAPEVDETSMMLSKEAAVMLSRPSQEQIHAMLGRSDLEFAPQVYSLKAGDQITGILEGHGPSTTFTQIDPIARTEVSREVDTWILRHPVSGYRLSILSSVQLDKKLPPFMPADGFECEVTIFRGEDQKTSKNFRVTDYTVAGTKRPDGKRRSWVQAKVIQVEGRESRTIDGPATAPQLADGEDAQA